MSSGGLLRGRVGIVTYIHNVNYGSALQAFALQEVIDGMGYRAEIVDYLDTSNVGSARERKKRLASGLLGMLRAPRVALRLRVKAGHARAQSAEKAAVFKRFEEGRLHISHEDYTLDGAYDAFVCGSDQVWSLVEPGLNRTFFLRFTDPSKRVAYAPSFGSDVVPSYNRKRLASWLAGFSHVSVREESGVAIVRDFTGSSPERVLDPVLLAGRAFWNGLIASMPKARFRIPRAYALGYFLSDNEAAVSYTTRLAREHGVELLWVDTGVAAPSGASTVTPDPLEFVFLLLGAKWVATDSFHGLAFSLMLDRDFYLFNRAYEGNARQSTRIDSMLSVAGLSQGDSEDVLRLDGCSIDRGEVDTLLSVERGRSMKYLRDALEDACSHKCSGERDW